MTRALLVLGLAAALAGCTKKGEWLVGTWLLVDEEGKVGVCHEFRRERTLKVYTGQECTGTPDQSSSGRWEAKEDTKIAILRYNERKGAVALVTERDAEHFVTRGALAGTLYRVGPKGAAEVIAKLEAKGAIKIKGLPPAWGCDQLTLRLAEVRRLPKEPEPRMLRQKDQHLAYHQRAGNAEAKIDKVVYALNGDQLEWVALHLAAAAFDPPGPQARLEESIGKPNDAVATGAGEKRQHIVMWKAYCAAGKDAPKRDIDVTLFATGGAKRGTIYVSENVVSSLWEDLKLVARDPAAQATEDDDGGEEGAAAPQPTAGPKQAEPKAAAEKPAPEKKAPAAAAKKAADPDDDI